MKVKLKASQARSDELEERLAQCERRAEAEAAGKDAEASRLAQELRSTSEIASERESQLHSMEQRRHDSEFAARVEEKQVPSPHHHPTLSLLIRVSHQILKAPSLPTVTASPPPPFSVRLLNPLDI